MRQYKTVSIKKVLQTTLGKVKAERYLKGIDRHEMLFLIDPRISDRENANKLYQATLAKLVDGNMEKALNYLVYGLEIDRDNKLLFSLCKNLAFSLNKQVEDNSDQIKRHRYSEDTEMNSNIIKVKIEELERTIEREENKIDKLEKELYDSKPNFFSVNKFFITYQIKKRYLKPQIKDLKESEHYNKEEVEKLKSELVKVDKLLILEEYLKTLSLLMEICIFPVRFETHL